MEQQNKLTIPTILVVEDDTCLWTVIQRSTKSLYPGIKTLFASSLEVAKSKVAEERPSLIVCDYLLPNLHDGMEFWNFCARYQPAIPFLLISSIGTERFLELTRHMNERPAFLSKPFSVKDLQITVENLLKGSVRVQKTAA